VSHIILDKYVRPLIALPFNSPKSTRGLDALSGLDMVGPLPTTLADIGRLGIESSSIQIQPWY
jgi:hypothetical protein